MSTPKPVFDESFEDTIIIQGLPSVDTAKASKLISFVEKKFAEFQPLSTDMPMGEDGNNLKVMFMRFATSEQAKAAVAGLNGKPLDKVHTFSVDLFSTPDLYTKYPDEYVPLNIDTISRKCTPYLNDHLLDPQFREQLLIRFDDEKMVPQTHINYVDIHNEDILVPHFTAEALLQQNKRFTTSRTGFSPTGSYIYTFHQQGIALWAGPNVERVTSIAHDSVCEIDFSPCERYLVTMSEQQSPSIFCDVAVWDIASSTVIVRYNNILRDQVWPMFKWSYDGRYFARIANKKIETKDGDKVKLSFQPFGIALYDTIKREIVGGKPLPAQNLVDYAFSPAGPELAFCCIGQGTLPSRLVIYDVDKKRELRNNPTFGVENWVLQWQESGEHLLVYMDRKVEKWQGTQNQSSNNAKPIEKKTTVHALDVYFIKKKNIPLVEYPLPKAASSLKLSPTQRKVLTTSFHINEKGLSKAEFQLFSFNEQSIELVWSETIPFPSGLPLEPALYSEAFQTLWSPQGETFIIAAISSLQANVLVLDASKEKHVDILASDLQLSHGNKVVWDHSGRYFAIASLRPLPTNKKDDKSKYKEDWKSQVQSRFQIYDFQGRLLLERKVPRLYVIQFRPYPIKHLNSQEKMKITQDLKSKFWPIYERVDDRFEKSKQTEDQTRRTELRIAWRQLRSKCLQQYIQSRPQRKELYNPPWASDEEDEGAYEVVELSRTSKVISTKQTEKATKQEIEATTTPE